MTATTRVDVRLVRRGHARSREHAAGLVHAGRVRAAGRAVVKPAQRVPDEAELEVVADPADPGYASRAAHKLAGALAVFGPHGLCVRGRRCVDVGASTGGFTDVLLRAGAAEVVCLDVGHDQLVPRLRDDPRTTVHDGRNVRDVIAADLFEGSTHEVDRAHLVVVDVSFISVTLVLPAVLGLLAPGGDLVLMVKPQFEVGRGRLGRGGVVRDAGLRREAVHGVVAEAAARGRRVRGVTPSPLAGPAGNVEFFVWLAPTDEVAADVVPGAASDGAAAPVTPEVLDAVERAVEAADRPAGATGRAAEAADHAAALPRPGERLGR